MPYSIQNPISKIQEKVHMCPSAPMHRSGFSPCPGVTVSNVRFLAITDDRFEEQEILIVTPAAPLGQAIRGKRAGDLIQIRMGAELQSVTVASVE